MKKTVLITGGTRGIGRAIANQLCSDSFNLVINYSSNETDALSLSKELNSSGCIPLLIKADISNSGSVKNMFNTIIKEYGSIDILVNNAGINIDRPFLEMKENEWDDVININMKGVFLVSQQAAKYMMKQETGGLIINIGATTGIGGRINGINYCAAKAALLVMTRCMAKELGPKIRVNSVIPGFTRTEESERRFNLKENEQLELSKRKIPLNRLAEPQEIAELIEFLISSKASYINGQKFIIDGGEYMC